MNQKVIDVLNDARSHELTAIAQYMIHHYELEDVMYGKLAEQLKKIAIVEMKHAEEFAERILYLGGVATSKPFLSPDTSIAKKQSIPDLLKNDIGLETEAIRLYNEYAKVCGDEGDHVSKRLFEKIASQEDEHLDYFQNTADFVDKLGASFLAVQTGEAND